MSQKISILANMSQKVNNSSGSANLLTIQPQTHQVVTPVVIGVTGDKGEDGLGAGDLKDRVEKLEEATDGLVDGASPVDFFNITLNS